MDEQCVEHKWLPFVDCCGPRCPKNGKQVGWQCAVCFALDFSKRPPDSATANETISNRGESK